VKKLDSQWLDISKERMEGFEDMFRWSETTAHYYVYQSKCRVSHSWKSATPAHSQARSRSELPVSGYATTVTSRPE